MLVKIKFRLLILVTLVNREREDLIVDSFWSGCAGVAKWGLEIGGVGVIDLSNHYTEELILRSEKLLCISKYIAVDIYFF